MSNRIRFFFNDVQINLRDRTILKLFLASLFKREKHSIDFLNIIFCTDERLLQINSDFLKHHYYTDIITFHYASADQPIQAELYISVDRVRENANSLGVTLYSELHRVIFHGSLHLCGYGDKTSQQIKKMREREDYYLRLYFSKRKQI
ncbi:MAG TPA: rRNA maturation RNase YbeY [Lacibacter sp.]|nr:rRNA maturation RNase YbeY [Lacibacter sp.]